MRIIKFNNMKNKSIIYLFLITILCSCEPEPIENYKDCVVYRKLQSKFGKEFTLKCKKDSIYYFKTVYVMELDWNKYNLEDTIK